MPAVWVLWVLVVAGVLRVLWLVLRDVCPALRVVWCPCVFMWCGVVCGWCVVVVVAGDGARAGVFVVCVVLLSLQ